MSKLRRRQRIIEKYTCGDCGVLALALHEQTGFVLVGARYKTARYFNHFGVRYNRKYWDIRGCLTGQEFRNLGLYLRNIIVDQRIIETQYKDCRRTITSTMKEKAIEDFLKLHHDLPTTEFTPKDQHFKNAILEN